MSHLRYGRIRNIEEYERLALSGKLTTSQQHFNGVKMTMAKYIYVPEEPEEDKETEDNENRDFVEGQGAKSFAPWQIWTITMID